MPITIDETSFRDANSLRGALLARIEDADGTSPLPNDREGEPVLAIFQRLATSSDRRALLSEVVTEWLVNLPPRAVVNAALFLTTHVPLPSALPPFMTWLDRNASQLDGVDDSLALAIIEGLATLQPAGAVPYQQFWNRLWNEHPRWTPSVFKALRLNSPREALRHVRELIQRARGAGHSPVPLLAGLAEQQDARVEVVAWLRSLDRHEANSIVSAIEPHVSREASRVIRTAVRRPLFPNPVRDTVVQL